MVFSSLQFILIFAPIFYTAYYTAKNDCKNLILLLGSLTFYFIGTISAPLHFILFIVSILLDFTAGLLIEKTSKYKKVFLTFDVIFHLLSLFIFKYSNFIFGELGKISDKFIINAEIVLPIGISFYTFQGISYVIDVYRKKTDPEKSLLRYAVYISMFEQLIAGPIVTYGQVKNELRRRSIKKDTVMEGVGIFVFGLGLKVLLANPVGKLWTQTQTIGFESISTPLAWMSLIAYSFQIYFDFFGYSLMAVGLGKTLGFELPKNFNHPYTSVTMTEFWRRWHITLGTWFKDYVYITLGGNRNGTIKTVLNLLVVWLLTAVWHGAGYNFLLWGFILFLIIITEKFFIGKYLNRHKILGHIYMIIIIPLTWSIFAVEDINQLKVLYGRLFPFLSRNIWSVFRYDYLKYLIEYYPFFIAGILFSTKLPYRILNKLKNKKAIIYIFLTATFISALYCMYRGFDDPFLYFRF